jgi:AAA domain, putative AbiEii toxin, Type IV TA system/Protein of unknown function (DUF4435)
MRFRSLRIANLRAIRLFEVEDLKDFIIVAGPNGSGKSCVFDAIRLLKSVYGGYSADEYMQWFGELEIDFQDRTKLRRIFQNPNRPVEINATLEFTESEAAYILANANDLAWPLAWEQVTGQRVETSGFRRAHLSAAQLQQFGEPVTLRAGEMAEELRQLEQTRSYALELKVHAEGVPLVRAPCLPVEVAFPHYQRDELGIIEYHSASRFYPRQQIGGINLDPTAFEAEHKQQTLYNSQGKYQNIKTELATGYLRGLIASQIGSEDRDSSLDETLKELFRTFFPEKEYLGIQPRPDGSLDFPVLLPGGARHDIDDLSSGEKEILYGYLRLRNSTPPRSVILLDEPELHLNPGLLEGFADFYYRQLGLLQECQLWLVTHSDTLLRRAIGNSNYGVYHMLSASSSEGNQASEIILADDVERAVVDLVGDRAAYLPHAKVVILEGKSEGGFDALLIKRLFPDFAKRVNLVSGGSKRRVKDLYSALNDSAEAAGISDRFFAIVDSDAEGFRAEPQSEPQVFSWDVYHIENFLLDPAAVRAAVQSLKGEDPYTSDEGVLEALRQAGEEVINRLVLEKLRSEINSELVTAIDLGAPQSAEDIAAALRPSIDSSLTRLRERGSEFSAEKLEGRVSEIRATLKADLEGEEWLKRFPGRLVLKRFVARQVDVDYESFRNAVLDKMVLAEGRPQNIRAVLDRVLAA